MPVTAVNRREFGTYVRNAPISAVGFSRSERQLGRTRPDGPGVIVRAADPGHDRFLAQDRRSGTYFKPDLHAGG